MHSQPHADQLPRIFQTKLYSDAITSVEKVKNGDLVYLIAGAYGLFGWGYITEVTENKDERLATKPARVSLYLNITQPNVLSVEEIRAEPDLKFVYDTGNKNFVEMIPKSINLFNKLMRSKGITSPEDVPEFEDRIGKFGVRDTTSLRPKLQLAVEKYNKASVLFLDLDNFKKVNDDYDHTVGDIIIKQALEVVQVVIQNLGELFHRSGDEMVVSLPDLGEEESRKIAEKIRSAVEQYSFSVIGQGIVTATIGLATYPDICEQWEDLEQEADKAMVGAKKIRKNSVATKADFI